MSSQYLQNMSAGQSSLDFQAIVSDLRRMIPQVAPEWTYTGDDDFGMVLLQFAAYLTDHQHYRADATMRDVIPTRSPHREIVREFAEWLGYQARRATAAEVDVTFSLDEALDEDVSIRRGTKVSGSGPEGSAEFEVDDGVVLLAGTRRVSAYVVQGTTTYRQLLGYATGRPFERFKIPFRDCLFNWADDDLIVEVDGVEASHLRYPALATTGQLSYWVRLDPDGLLSVRFGDGTFGRILAPGSEVRATLRRGGGPVGNVGAGAINTVVTTFKRLDGTAVDLKVTNDGPAAPGLDAESLDSIRTLAPAFFRSQGRAVTREDYATQAMRVPGVYQVRVTPSGVNGVTISVVPAGLQQGVRLSRALASRISRFLDPIKMATDCLYVQAARLVTLDVSLVVRAQRNARAGGLADRVRRRFIGDGGMFTESKHSINDTLWLSDMIGDIEGVPQVDNLDVVRYCRRPEIRWGVATGEAAISAAGVTLSATTRAQSWRIDFVDATTFTLTGDVTGAVDQLFTLGAPVNVAGEVSFVLEEGEVAMAQGDWGDLVVGALVGNIELGPDEFPIFDARSVSIQVLGGIGS